MSRKNIVVAICAVVVIVLAVLVFSPNREEQAQAQFDAAHKVEQAGEFDQAMTLYEALIKEYQGTEAAVRAADSISRVMQHKERAFIQEVYRDFGRIFLVLKGYREMLGKNPATIQDLDNDSYMFDSAYIVDIVPEGYTFYLRLDNGGQSSTIYSIKNGFDKVVKRSESNETSVFSLSDFEKEVNSAGYTKIEKGRMVFLQPAKD